MTLLEIDMHVGIFLKEQYCYILPIICIKHLILNRLYVCRCYY